MLLRVSAEDSSMDFLPADLSTTALSMTLIHGEAPKATKAEIPTSPKSFAAKTLLVVLVAVGSSTTKALLDVLKLLLLQESESRAGWSLDDDDDNDNDDEA